MGDKDKSELPIIQHTPIEQWIEESRNKSWPKQKGITNTESNKSMAKKVAFTRGCKELLTYLGLSGIENPREWVEKMKSKSSLNYGGGFSEEDITINALRGELTKLQSELKQAKADKAKAWEEGYESRVKFIDDYFGTKTNIELPEPTNPYKEEPNHN